MPLINLLAVVVPLGLAGAVSPVLLTEQTVMLSRSGGRRLGVWFGIGAVLVLAAYVALLVLFGRSIKLPKTPHLSAQLDVTIGIALIALAAWMRLRREGESTKPQPKQKSHSADRGVAGAFSFGCFSMATNFTTLALMVPAAKEVAASHLELTGRAVATIVIVALAAIPVWLPLALTRVAPDSADRVLGGLKDLTARRGRQIGRWALAAVGAYLTVRGFVRLT
ncbi:MAG: GAP family protein [Solirubrobacterales bacterium]